MWVFNLLERRVHPVDREIAQAGAWFVRLGCWRRRKMWLGLTCGGIYPQRRILAGVSGKPIPNAPPSTC
jgi:hypothetical protein